MWNTGDDEGGGEPQIGVVMTKLLFVGGFGWDRA